MYCVNNVQQNTHTTADGFHSTAGGLYSTANDFHSTAGGLYSNADGFHSTAGGLYSTADGFHTYADGFLTLDYFYFTTIYSCKLLPISIWPG